MWNGMPAWVQFLSVYAITGVLYSILMLVMIEYSLQRREKLDADVQVKLLRITEVPIIAVACMSFFLWPYLLFLTIMDMVKRKTE